MLDITRRKHTPPTLTLGEDVVVVKNKQELTQAAALVVLASTAELVSEPVDGILFTDTGGKDHLHYRRGILTEVAAKQLAADNKALVIGLETLFSTKNVPRALGRALQDAKLAATHGADVVFVSLGEEFVPTSHDLEATFRALGFAEELVAKNEKTLEAWVGRARHRASDDYIAEGVSKAKGI